MMKSASRNANETPTLKFVVTCVPGLERLLSDELAEMGILEVEADGDEKHPTGALRFAGSWADAAKVLVGSRLASRLLLELREFAAVNADMLYDQVRRVKWADYMRPGRTLAVFAHGKSPGRDLVLSFAALKIKDAVCDEIRKHGVDRPDVDRENPDIRLEAHFQEGRCRLSLDLSGAPLHRRGQRTEAGEAPLRENRAAALLRLVGLRAGAEGLFVDPFCGSGTILLEAAAIAENRAPGLVRRAREFKGALFSMELEAALEAELVRASKAVVPLKLRLEGRDVESRQLEKAKRNLRGRAELVRADFRERDLEADWVVTNPPHGVRIGDVKKTADLLGLLAQKLKHAATPSKLGLALTVGPLEKAVGLRPSKKLTVDNGPEGLRLLAYEIRPGKFK